MKKLYSLIRACMTSDMNIFKVSNKKKKNSSGLTFSIIIGISFMFIVWVNTNGLFEKLAPYHIQNIVLALYVFSTAMLVIIEGIYKTGPLLFNCKDDQLLFSLPIKKRTILFVRIFKFYVFEFIFTALFIFPLALSYARWGENVQFSFYITSIVMLFILPIIPVVISCIIGVITTSISSRFKYKNAVEIIISMIIILGVFYFSFNLENIINNLMQHANNYYELIKKIYYPAGLYSELAVNFDASKLIMFVIVNLLLLSFTIYILSLFYFKINSRIKKVVLSKKKSISELNIKSNSKSKSLVKKELNTFFKTPVFIVNAGFGLVIFIILTILIIIKYEGFVDLISSSDLGIDRKMIVDNSSLVIFALVTITSFMTSITNSVISLEGKNINILKALPIKTKTILMSKIYSSLVLTTPVLIICDILLFVKLKISIIEMILILLLSIVMPLVSHFIGLLMNLKYPKLDAENSAEVVKQSTSSFLSVLIGMILLILTLSLTMPFIGIVSSTVILLITLVVFIFIDFILYLLLCKRGTKKFNSLSI